MISFRLTRRGCITCLRLNASSWRVRPAARFAARLISSTSARRGSVRSRPSSTQVGVAEDGGEHVVEVVRDAAGEPPDRFHLLRLAQLRFAEAQRLLGAAPLASGRGSRR